MSKSSVIFNEEFFLLGIEVLWQSCHLLLLHYSCSYLKEKSTRKSIDLLQLADDGTGTVELWHSVAHPRWKSILAAAGNQRSSVNYQLQCFLFIAWASDDNFNSWISDWYFAEQKHFPSVWCVWDWSHQWSVWFLPQFSEEEEQRR